MATIKQTTVSEIGRRVLEMLVDRPVIDSIWIDERPDEVEVWVVTKPSDDHDRLDDDTLWEPATAIRRSFPGLRLHYHVIYPEDWVEGTFLSTDAMTPTARRIDQS